MKNLFFKQVPLLLLSCMFFSSCNHENKGKKQTILHSVKSKEMSVIVPDKIEDIISIPSTFLSRYSVKKENDLSYNGINRIQQRITVPTGLNKSQVKNNIKHAVITCYNKQKWDGISILVFKEGENIESAYTVAMGEFAPMGEWDNIKSNVSLTDFRLKISLKDYYFNKKEASIKKGDTVKLKGDGNNVAISNSSGEWTKKCIITSIPNNVSVRILEIIDYGHGMLRYKVKAIYKGKEYIGWIHGEEVMK